MGTPTPSEVIPALVGVAPGVVRLLLRKELQGLLCNLKVLDWIVIEEALRATTEDHPFVGESDVIDWIWDRWIGRSSDRHAKAGLLVKIGEDDGGSLTPFVNIGDLDHAERQTVGHLEQDRLVRVRHSIEISFTHDLIGDWARLQSLLMSGTQVAAKIRRVVELPRWQRAVRLYAQHLLEHQDGAARWKEAMAALHDESSIGILAADCFLDALIFAGNAEALLEQVWPELTGDNGSLLRRLLKRFLHIATVPDPRMQVLTEKEDLDWSSVIFRIPYILYWYVPLRVLERHSDDVCRLGLILATELCELWLRTIPPEWGGRTDAAKLAIKLAKEAQGRIAEETWLRDRDEQKVYEALLHASREFRDEVAQIALELCHRREESPEIKARAFAYHEKRRAEMEERIRLMPPEEARRRSHPPPPVMVGWDDGPMREAAQDGPAERVPDSFQSAVLNSTALISLAQVRPAVAREVLLAVCIDEPQPARYSDDPLDAYGTSNWQRGYPPMFFRGPFLSFLRAQPGEGLEAILRLVNYATERWVERALREAPPDLNPDQYSVALALPQGTVRWTGDNTVFTWYRDILIGSNSVASALMALEKWLYEELDQDRRIDQWTATIFDRSASVAFAGLLVAVGLRTPKLFAGPLRPLFTAWPLYDWQRWEIYQDSWRIGMSSWAGSGERLYQEVVSWHTMPHRKKLLLDTAIELFVTDTTVRQFLNAQAQTWAKEPQTHPNESLELLIARFDPKNYSATELGDGRIRINFDWPEQMRGRTTARAEAAGKDSLAITFPYRCRRILNGEETIEATQAEAFWKQFQVLVDWCVPEEAGASPVRRSAIVAGHSCPN